MSFLAAAVFLSCSTLLGIEPSERRDAGTSQGGTPVGSGGTTSAGDAGAPAGGVGAEGGAMGGGGAGEGSEGASGGNGGAAGTGGNAAGGADGGDGGHGGEPPPEPGGKCDGDVVEMACSTARPQILLECDEDVWVARMFCPNGQLCNPKEPACRNLAPECRDDPRFLCQNDQSIDCAADPFEPPHRICPFGCASGECLVGTGDQLIVHTEPPGTGIRDWPGQIPVCFASDAEADGSMRGWTRSEVERGWGRYLDVVFEGWGICESADTPGVVVEFIEDCRGRIAGPLLAGYPGDRRQRRVGICRTYRDASDEPHDMNEPLARFVARHQFGHVLGLDEESRSVSTTMVRGIRSSAIDSTVWADDVRTLFTRHGYKPQASLVHASSWCLDSAEGTVSLASCSANTSQRVHPFPDRTEFQGTAQCLAITGSGVGVELVACSPPPANALVLRRARWSSPGHCIAPRNFPVVPGTPIETRPCAAVGDPSQTWVFEISAVVDNRPQARIRFAAQDYCVTAPEPLSRYGGEVPTLEPCGPASTLFELGPDGDVSVLVPDTEPPARLWLEWPGNDGVLAFRTGSGGRPFMLTGPLETADGHALSADLDDPGAGLSVVMLGQSELPASGQVFDVPF